LLGFFKTIFFPKQLLLSGQCAYSLCVCLISHPVRMDLCSMWSAGHKQTSLLVFSCRLTTD